MAVFGRGGMRTCCTHTDSLSVTHEVREFEYMWTGVAVDSGKFQILFFTVCSVQFFVLVETV